MTPPKPPEIVTPLTFGDALAMVDLPSPPWEELWPAQQAQLAHVLMAVDQASRDQAWEARGGPGLVKALRDAYAFLDDLEASDNPALYRDNPQAVTYWMVKGQARAALALSDPGMKEE